VESREGVKLDTETAILLESSPDPTPSPPNTVNILKATYGVGWVHRDDTDGVRAKVKQDPAKMGTNGVDTGPDPAPGITKSMYIRFSLNGMIYAERAWDGASFSLLDVKGALSLANTLDTWNKSKTINGRSIIPGMCEGGNSFGPTSANVIEHFQGWFDVAAQEHLQFAALSRYPVFIMVDGKEVGRAVTETGTSTDCGADMVADVDLAPGTHLLESYLVYPGPNRYGSPLQFAAAVKGGPIANWTSLMPGNTFFRPIGQAHVVDYQLQSSEGGGGAVGNAPPFAIDWVINGQSVIAPEVGDLGLISVQFNCRTALIGTATWTFDDGATASGASVVHVFARPGMRTVKVSIQNGANDLGTITQAINVQPNWALNSMSQPQLWPDHEAAILTLDPSKLSVSDLAGCAAVFGIYKNTPGLLKILPALCAKMKDVSEADVPYVEQAGIYLVSEEPLHYAEAIQLYKALVARCTPPTPAIVRNASRAQSALAQLLLESTDQFADVKALLDGVNPAPMNYEEQRTIYIQKADLALAMGDLAGAKKLYLAVPPVAVGGQGADSRSSIRMTGGIRHAQAFLDQKDYDAAAEKLGEVAWYSPVEKMSADWALTQLQLEQEMGLTLPAYIWATRLMPVITESERSELLFRMAGLAFTLGHDDVAKKALTELLQKYPYSAEAAQAKQKWPGKI
jgi:hypothetical protein